MFTELKQPWYVHTPRGAAYCVAVIDYGAESDLMFVCVTQQGGQFWVLPSPQVRMGCNFTLKRTEIDTLPQEPSIRTNQRKRKVK